MRKLWTGIFIPIAVSVVMAQAPMVRAHMEPATGVLAGEPVRLVVQILAPNYFTGSPDFPEFELENAIVVQPQERAENSSVKINGVTYAGISETYFLYPQQPGDYHITPVQFTVPYANKPPASTIAHVQMPSLTFRAELPAAAQNTDTFLPTTRLTIQQRWSVPLNKLRVGDTVERIITITAMKMQAMLIPPLPIHAPDGIRIYPEQATVQDQKTSTGEFVYGRRIERAQYFIQKDGEYTLPAIQLQWWNLNAKRLERATLPAIHFNAAPNPDLETALPPEAALAVATPAPTAPWWVRYRSWIRIGGLVALLLLLCSWVCWKFLPLTIRALRRKFTTWRLSEAAFFRHLLRACHHNDAMEAYRRLLAWLAVAWPGCTLEEFLAEAKNPELLVEINRLGAYLFSPHPHGHWNGERLSILLKQNRIGERKSEMKAKRLLPLNP